MVLVVYLGATPKRTAPNRKEDTHGYTSFRNITNNSRITKNVSFV